MRYLLDTHALVWWIDAPERLTRSMRAAISKTGPQTPLLVSDISLLEIATLAGLGRLAFTLPLRDWLERATAAPLVERVPITPAIAGEVSVLPASFHRDPGDRVIVATARVLGASVITRDRLIVDSKVVETIS